VELLLADWLEEQGDPRGELLRLRGGWGISGGFCRSAKRDGSRPGDRDRGLGFRKQSQAVLGWMAEAKVEALLGVLAQLGPVPAELAAAIRATTDPEVLQRWILLAARSATPEQFRRDAGLRGDGGGSGWCCGRRGRCAGRCSTCGGCGSCRRSEGLATGGAPTFGGRVRRCCHQHPLP
jgi:hypothetical protein